MTVNAYLLGKTVLQKADGTVKVLDNVIHAFIASHPFWACLFALIIGGAVGHIL